MQQFAGKRVAITGGTAGLGLALVHELIARGADVAFIARTPDGVMRVAQEYVRGAHGIVADVSVKGDIHRIALQVLGALGGLDILTTHRTSVPCHCNCWPTPSVRTSSVHSRRTSSDRSG